MKHDLRRYGIKTTDKFLVDQEITHLKKTAALLQKCPTLKEEEKVDLQKALADYFQISPADLSDDHLLQIKTLQPKYLNPSYVSPEKLLVEKLEKEDEIAGFIVDWRKFFVDSLQPKCLPSGWSIHRPVDK